MVCMPEWFSVIVRAVSGSECGMSVCSEGGASCTSQADQLGSHHSLAEQLDSRNSLAEQLGSRSSLGAASETESDTLSEADTLSERRAASSARSVINHLATCVNMRKVPYT